MEHEPRVGHWVVGTWDRPTTGKDSERSLLHFAYRIARRQGLDEDDAQDCAIEFVERMLLDETRAVALARMPDAWVHRCATNYAHNYRRARQRVRTWEAGEVATTGKHELISPDTLLSRLIGEVTWCRVCDLLGSLDPGQISLLGLGPDHRSASTCVETTNGSVAAARRQARARLRSRLRGALQRRGVEEADLRCTSERLAPCCASCHFTRWNLEEI
jgi:DNA-directed RNA polymerase specialized sigma24 family protein